MPNEIQNKMSGASAVTCTLASLADGSGRQTDVIDNESIQQYGADIHVEVTTGTSPTNGAIVQVYLIAFNADDEGDDGAGLVDAAYTRKNAPLIDTLVSDGTNNESMQKTIKLASAGPLPVKFALGFVNETGAALNATGSNHAVKVTTRLPEIQ